MAAKRKAKKSKSLVRSKKLQRVKPLSVMTAASPLNLTQGATGGASAGAAQHGDFSITKAVDKFEPHSFPASDRHGHAQRCDYHSPSRGPGLTWRVLIG